MKKHLAVWLVLATAVTAAACRKPDEAGGPAGPKTELSRSELFDKIKGGWAGQVIGCTFGGPTEFRFPGAMIPDYQAIPWNESLVAARFERSPGLYDDVYMDLTFLEVMAREGIDAPASSHAQAFARAPYPLWHANQAARYNVLNGLLPPDSGHWTNSPHADDIDFQIEADFAGLMSPGLVNAGAEICDRVGHIMNYGDGWYGGVYVAAMYSLAFVSADPGYVVEEALKVLPPGSSFARCIRDVVACHRADPADWKKAWFEVERKWAQDVGCPDFVFDPGNIDARVNGAYIVIGLLYGGGDFGRTLEIATRCGQDSDCNPASAGGILGTMLGYEGIPPVWRDPVKAIEDKPFPYTAHVAREGLRNEPGAGPRDGPPQRRHRGRGDRPPARRNHQGRPARGELQRLLSGRAPEARPASRDDRGDRLRRHGLCPDRGTVARWPNTGPTPTSTGSRSGSTTGPPSSSPCRSTISSAGSRSPGATSSTTAGTRSS